jgi:hypothetical protein
MNPLAIASLVVTLMAGTAVLELQDAPKADAPKMRPPDPEHEWLQQLTGEWDAEVEAHMEPGKPPQKSKGTQSVRAVGGFWILSEINGICPAMDAPFTGLLTLGYDQDQKKFVGTWVDSMGSYLWKYEGTLDPARRRLTLTTEGPCPMAPDKRSRFREVIELTSKDHQVFTTSIQGEDGKWVTMMTCHSRRKPGSAAVRAPARGAGPR